MPPLRVTVCLYTDDWLAVTSYSPVRETAVPLPELAAPLVAVHWLDPIVSVSEVVYSEHRCGVISEQ